VFVTLANGITLNWFAGNEDVRSLTMVVNGDYSQTGTIYDNNQIAGGGPLTIVSGGATVTGSLHQTVWDESPGYCPGCVRPVEAGVDGVGMLGETCEIMYYEFGVTDRVVNYSFTAPSAPGRYTMRQGGQLDYSCYYTGGQAIGLVIVK
jgi:hypothetical protein